MVTMVEHSEDWTTVAVEAAREAGAILLDRMEKGVTIEFKGVMDLVTDADRTAERAIVNRILTVFPAHQILAEEGGVLTSSDSPCKWVIDPLDGTTNYTHGFPSFCISIGLEVDGVIVVGVVFDPMREELFVAEKGKGATCNGQRIAVSKVASLNHALLVTGFSYDVRQDKTDNNFNFFRGFVICAQGVRRTGSAALDLCYVAMGRFDGFWEMKLAPWDVAAGSLMVAEAGGVISSFAGNPFSVYSSEVLASNGLIQHEMLRVLADQGSPAKSL
mgnify:CR=1 FL=1|tara:strand:- start:7426 stop:8247 length:822 start_codon:yes stop_codon:yes gene_type:complete